MENVQPLCNAPADEPGASGLHAPRRILVVCRDRRVQRQIQRILGATLHTIDVAEGVLEGEQLCRLHVPALLVIDQELLQAAEGVALLTDADRLGVGACLVLASPGSLPDLPRLLRAGAITNLLGRAMPTLAEELTVTALKVLRHDIFGLEKYLTWGVPVVSRSLDCSDQRADLVDELSATVKRLGIGSRAAQMAALVADELMTNAIFNAPVDAAGTATRRDERRDTVRPLAGREQVWLRYACDARYLAIEVTDAWGSLSRSTILACLAKGVSRDVGKVIMQGGGAGIGVGLVYDSCHHLVFNLHPRERTQVIGLFDLRVSPQELGQTPSSFNIFVER